MKPLEHRNTTIPWQLSPSGSIPCPDELQPGVHDRREGFPIGSKSRYFMLNSPNYLSQRLNSVTVKQDSHPQKVSERSVDTCAERLCQFPKNELASVSRPKGLWTQAFFGVRGLHPVIHKANFWLCTQGSLLLSLGDHIECQGSNMGLATCKQLPYLLYYCSGS